MKNNPVKYILFFVSFFVSVLSLHGQDFKKDYNLVHDTYIKMDNFYCELKINVFDDEKSNVPMQKMFSVIKKRTTDYWYSMGGIKMLVRDNFILYIDEDAKQMIYTIRDKKRELVIPDQNAAGMIDSVLKRSDSVVYKGMKENLKKYIVYSNKETISRSELWINTDNNLITKIIYYYNSEKGLASNKVEINYLKMNLNPQFSDSEFSEKSYASISKKEIRPAGKYIGFETTVIDQHDIK